MNVLETIRVWMTESKWSQARRSASRWKRQALSCLRELQKSSDRLQIVSSKIDTTYKESLGKLNDLYQDYLSLSRDVDSRVTRAQETIDRYDHAEEMLNNELEVYREVVVPQLTLAAEIGRQQLEAEIALQIQRQVYYGADNTTKKE